jgi:hypothetical protein
MDPMSAYDTNLAAEYYVLSCLHRRGVTAALTLGNKKGIDILVARSAGDAATVEVKGVAKKYDWPADNVQSTTPDRHYVALVSFEGKIDDPTMPPPRVWIIPFKEIGPFFRQYKGRRNISRSQVVSSGTQYENGWHLIEECL